MGEILFVCNALVRSRFLVCDIILQEQLTREHLSHNRIVVQPRQQLERFIFGKIQLFIPSHNDCESTVVLGLSRWFTTFLRAHVELSSTKPLTHRVLLIWDSSAAAVSKTGTKLRGFCGIFLLVDETTTTTRCGECSKHTRHKSCNNNFSINSQNLTTPRVIAFPAAFTSKGAKSAMQFNPKIASRGTGWPVQAWLNQRFVCLLPSRARKPTFSPLLPTHTRTSVVAVLWRHQSVRAYGKSSAFRSGFTQPAKEEDWSALLEPGMLRMFWISDVRSMMREGVHVCR